MTDSPQQQPTPQPQQQPYAAAPPPAYGAPANAPVPGRTLGIVALVLSFFIQLVALILGIVALVQSRKAGASNGPAIAAIIISSILIVIGIILLVMFFTFGAALFGGLAAACAELGPGTHTLEGGGTITCG